MAQSSKLLPASSFPAGHGVDPPSRSPFRRAKEGRSNSTPLRPGLPLARRGRLKNGNPSGDFLTAPRCGAHTRCGASCRQPAMPNGRCRLHGGLSTGPRTAAGLARSRGARWKHGARSAEVTALRRAARAQFRRVRTVLVQMRAPSAGHGVHRSISGVAPGMPTAKANLRERRDHRAGILSARAARNSPSSVRSVSSVVNPSSAGHGLHRSVSQAKTIGFDPRSPAFAKPATAGEGRSAAKPSFPAGHGVHRSNSQPQPAASVWPSRRERLRSSASICGLTYPRPLGMRSFARS